MIFNPIYLSNTTLDQLRFFVELCTNLIPDPPKHPRGVPWKEAIRGLDWIGGALFTVGAVMVLVGMVYTSYLSSTDVRVLVTLCVGFAFIVAFGLWERFSNVRFLLCPNDIFVSHYGREFTVPFCLTFIVVGYFYGSKSEVRTEDKVEYHTAG